MLALAGVELFPQWLMWCWICAGNTFERNLFSRTSCSISCWATWIFHIMRMEIIFVRLMRGQATKNQDLFAVTPEMKRIPRAFSVQGLCRAQNTSRKWCKLCAVSPLSPSVFLSSKETLKISFVMS